MRTTLWRRLIGRVTTAAAIGGLIAGLTVTGGATAAVANTGSLQQVSSFGANPGSLAMYEYAPAGLGSGRPLVVALHGCTQTATDYYNNSGWTKFADQWNFALVLPQTSNANNSLSCFSWFDASKDTRGNGEAASVRAMVDHAVQQYGTDRSRIYVTGLSAGGGLAADLLADYPDVFAGGAIDSGLPAQCATAQSAASGCQNSNQNLSPAQWGDKVRGSYPGWNGPWPRVAIWQGTSDYTVTPVNGTELRDQWTNVWGIGQTPSSTRTLTGGTTGTFYNDDAGRPAVALFSVSGMGHGLAVNPGSGADQCGSTGAYFLNTICSSYHTARFWGLDSDSSTGGGSSSLPAPTGLSVTATTSSTVGLAWSAVSGASGYAVLRGGVQVATVSSPSYTDTGLSPATTYSYTVTATDSAGGSSPASAAVVATTAAGSTAVCWTANNYNHVAAGRAHQIGGYVYANGSDQNMGLYNVFVTHTLKETPPGYFVIADSGCSS